MIIQDFPIIGKSFTSLFSPMDQNNNPTEMVDGVTPETAAKSEPTQKQPQS